MKNYPRFRKACYLLSLLSAPACYINAQIAQTFTYTGSMETFTVPSCVNTITVDVKGAQGGDAVGTTVGWGAGSVNLQGGKGGRVVATLTVTPGEVLNVFIGGKGTSAAGGFNGGGSTASCSGTEVLAGGGGGASDIRRGGVALTDRIIVAGGGGGVAGAGSASYQSVGGAGGNPIGQSASGGTGACLLGGGGTQSMGGAGGTNTGCSCNLTNVAGSGSLGSGGSSICAPSGLSTCSFPCSGAGCTSGSGGGGGYYGGGAGVARGSGGGGSSYTEGAATAVTHTQGFQNGDGELTISYVPSGTVSATATPSVICSGSPSTLSASGLVSYTWSPGGANTSSITVSPTVNTTYTLTGTNSLGCAVSSMISVNVNTVVPVVTASASTSSVCLNNPVTITAGGASTYTISNGVSDGVAFTPSATAVYTITGSNGCNTSSATVGVTVTTVPVSITPSSTLICPGNTVTLTAGGAGSAATYTWSGGLGSNTLIAVAPSASQGYSISATDGNGCTGTSSVMITVSPCTGIESPVADKAPISIYPNPSNGEFTVTSDQVLELEIVNELGAVVRKISLPSAGHQATVTNLANGIYFIVGKHASGSIREKIVVSR